MGTITTKFGLRKPASGDLYDVVADDNYNMDQIDAAMGDRICTSGTRPSTSIYVGLRVFETDTKAVIVITSLGPTVWRYVTNPVVASTVAMNALSPVHTGMVCSRSDTFEEYIYTGTLWRETYHLADRVVGGTRYITGVILATCGGTAVGMNMGTGGIDFLGGYTYNVRFAINFELSTNGDMFDFTIRDGSAVGSIMANSLYDRGGLPTGPNCQTTVEFQYKPVANINKQFVGAIQRWNGLGTCTVFASSTGETFTEVRRMGLAATIINV